MAPCTVMIPGATRRIDLYGSTRRWRVGAVLLVVSTMQAVQSDSGLALDRARAGSCSTHSGPHACATCAGAPALGGHCAWCPADGKCAQCEGIGDCKLLTKCSNEQMIQEATQCADSHKNWTAPPSKLISSCEFERTDCAHGTKMNNSYCQRAQMISWPMCPGKKCVAKDGHVPDVPEPAPYPEYIEPANHFLSVCKCPFWLNGTDCSIVVAPAALRKRHIQSFDACSSTTGAAGSHGRHVWDGSFINLKLEAAKHLECYLDPSETPFKLDAHRVNVTIMPAANGDSTLRDVSIDIMMRRVGSHVDAQPPTNLAAMQQCEHSPLNPYENMHAPYVPRGGPAVCLFPRQNDIACTAFSCKPSYVPSQTDANQWDAHYDCASAQCTPWAGLEASAKLLLAQISGQEGGIQFDFKNVNETFGTAQTLFVTKAVTFKMQCSTGQCVPTNQSAPSHPAHPPKKPISPWTVSALCVIGIIGLLSVWALVQIRRQQRPGTKSNVSKPLPQLRGGGASSGLSSNAGTRDTRPRVAVAFSDVGYSVAQDTVDDNAPSPGTRRVLQGASGLVQSGQMCAVMGPSGAGKSSLLDILAGQNKNGSVDGSVRLVLADGGTIEDTQKRRQVCRYVMQDDRILATETVEEALTFSACMTLPNSVPLDDIPTAVDEIIERLALGKVRRSRVGSSDAGGLSGGERRRLAVGLELITQPAVLLADEPTSGLDSVSADIVMKTLSKASHDGCSVIVTIHQPSAQVFALFDSVCLLSAGGGQAYFGPPAGALAIASRRLHAGGNLQNPIASATDSSVEVMQLERTLPRSAPHLNPAEELLEYLVEVGQEGVQIFRNSPDKASVDASISQILDATQQHSQRTAQVPTQETLIQANGESALLRTAPTSSDDGSRISHNDFDGDCPGGFAQFEMLCRRGLRQVVRDPSLMFLQLIVTVFVGALTGGVFYKPGLDLNGVHNRTGLLFFIVIYFSLISMSSIGAIVNDKETFLRERAAGLYTTEPFFASKILCDVLPLRVLPPVLFGLIVYPMCALHEGRIEIFIGAVLLLNTTASAMCFFAAAVSQNAGTANLWASLFFIYNMCFGGLLLTAHNAAVSVFMQLSFFFHAYEILMINEFDGYTELQFNPSHTSLGSKSALISGKTWLANVGMDVFKTSNLLLRDVLILATACVIFWVGGYVSFRVQRYVR